MKRALRIGMALALPLAAISARADLIYPPRPPKSPEPPSEILPLLLILALLAGTALLVRRLGKREK